MLISSKALITHTCLDCRFLGLMPFNLTIQMLSGCYLVSRLEELRRMHRLTLSKIKCFSRDLRLIMILHFLRPTRMKLGLQTMFSQPMAINPTASASTHSPNRQQSHRALAWIANTDGTQRTQTNVSPANFRTGANSEPKAGTST